MTKGKLIYPAVIFLLLLISISAASASDNSTEDIISADNSNEVVLKDNNDSILASESESDVLADNDGGTFAALKIKIDSAQENSTIYLENDYTCIEGTFETDGVVISTNNITINGLGHKISGNGKMRIFDIKADYVTLENIVFQSGKTDNGGAILWEGQYGSLNNCQFYVNEAQKYGGAVRWNGNYGTISYCDFKNNKAKYGGGLDWHGKNGGAYYCTFSFNTASSCAGAINWEGNSFKIYYCNITDNSNEDTTSQGSAVDFGGIDFIYGDVRYCYLARNNGGLGALDSYLMTGTISLCTFESNYNGAMNFGTADSCIFKTSVDSTYATNILSPTIHVSNLNCTYNSSAVFEFNVTTHGGIFIDNEIIEMEIYDGDRLIDAYEVINGQNWIVDLEVGNYTVQLTPERFSSVKGSATITVNKIEAQINSSTDNVTLFRYDELQIIYNVTPGDATEGITFTSSNPEVVSVDSVSGLMKAVSLGSANITISLSNKHYAAANVIVRVTVAKNSTQLNAPDINTTYQSNETLSITLKNNLENPLIGYNITVDLNGPKIYTTDSNGQVNISTENLAARTYDVEIRFAGDDNYAPSNITTELVIGKISSQLNVENLTTFYNSEKDFIVTLIGNNGNPLSGCHVTINLNGAWPEITDENGQAKLSTKGFAVDKYIAKVLFVGNENYTTSYALADVVVEKANTTITAENLNVTYGSGENIIITLADDFKTPISGYNITVDFNGVKIYTTDSNGQVKIPTKGLAANTYAVKITFGGDKNYVPSNATAKAVIVKANTSITAENVTATYNTDEYLIVTLTDSLGNPMAKYKITVDLNGKKSYTTDSNGQVKIPTKGLAVNTYSAKITFDGDKNYLKSNGKATVTVNKGSTILAASAVSTTYGKSKNLVITLKDSKGNKLSNVKVTVKVKSSKKYTTNKNGKIKVAIGKLVPKTYTAKITFKGNSNYEKSTKSVNVTVKKAKPKISAKAKTFKKSKKTKKYSIYLKANKKGIKKVKVTLKVNKKTYKAKTNSKGKATFKITKLNKKGKFTAKVKFAGNSYYKAVSKKVKITVKK